MAVFKPLRRSVETWIRQLKNVYSESHGSVEPGSDRTDPDEQLLLENIEKARQEWVAAKRYFESVSDPDLVDHAVYLLTAAERKYIYLLETAEDKGTRFDSLSPE